MSCSSSVVCASVRQFFVDIDGVGVGGGVVGACMCADTSLGCCDG